MSKGNLHLGIGMRTTKTAIAVMLCMLNVILIQYFNFGFLDGLEFTSFYACIAAVICMQNTVESTIKLGVSRLVGTAVGGAVGLVLLLVDDLTSYVIPEVVIVGVGIYVCMAFCNIIKRPAACAISGVVLLAVLINNKGSDRYVYAVLRMVETFYGIIVAILVNKSLNKPSFINKKQAKDDNKEDKPIIE